ncbi:TlpA family protein disulfide reductase [Micromonospora arborensis]|uniref:TlpA family protein disulfide reductase n=1 Tax=Micromonospora arborensis TaxID=2116518 RepID=UPI00371337F3
MEALIAAVSLLGVVGILNFVLTMGVIRRLRQHAEAISSRGGAASPTLEAGGHVGDFATTAVDGTIVASELITAESTIAFFSPSCGPCRERLPGFIEYAGRMNGLQQHVIAVVVGEESEAAEFASRLGAAATVVVETPDAGPLATACQVKAFPTILVADRDPAGHLTVKASGVDLDEMRAAFV